MSDPELLSAAIEASGLSVRQFAADVLIRDPRTVWRWLRGPDEHGAHLLPVAVRKRCEAILSNSGKPDPPI